MSDEERADSSAGADRAGDDEVPEASDRDPADERPGAPGEGGEEGAPEPEEVDDGSERLSAEIREELEEMDELRDRHLRLAAEFENYRKRTRREMREARERAQAALSERLLDALDDLERFLETPADETTAASLREGVEMVRDKLWKELSEAGLERMEPAGERFDPELHEALLTRPVEDREEGGKVSEVLMNGYVFGDRVLRPARVEVTKHQAGAGGDDAAEDESPDDENPDAED